MDKLQISARFRLHKGKAKEFKALAKEALLITKEKDKGVLQYDWFFNDDETECVVREAYKGSAGLLNHLGLLGDVLGKVMSMADFTGEIYGDVSDELRGALKGMDLKTYKYFQGL
jgi:quinol monooxygenase YgiN